MARFEGADGAAGDESVRVIRTHAPPVASSEAGSPAPERAAARGRFAPEVERVMAEVIDIALTDRPLRAAKWWYPALVKRLAGTAFSPPSRSTFEGRCSTERKRRRAQLLERSARATAELGRKIGDREIGLIPGEPPAGRQACEQVVSTLTSMRSTSIGDAYRDYLGINFRSGVPSMSKEAFRALVFTPLFMEGVTHDAMPDWWRRKAR